MPRHPNAVPSYLHFKAKNRGYCRIRGKVRYFPGPYGSEESTQAYARFLAERAVVLPAASSDTAAQPAAVLPGKNEDIFIAELCAAYLDYAEGHYVKNGHATSELGNVKRALHLLAALYGDTLAADFGPLALRACRQYMIDHPAVNPASGKTTAYTRKTINHTASTIRAIFKWAASMELLPVTVSHALATVEGLQAGRTAAPDHAPITAISSEIVEATLPHLPPIVAAMVRLQRLTGARPGEICQLRPGDIDRAPYLAGGGQPGKEPVEVWRYVPQSHKTEHRGRARVVFLGPKAQAVLRPFLLRDAEACCFSPREGEALRAEERRKTRKTPMRPSQVDRRKAASRKRPPHDHYTTSSYGRAVVSAIASANRVLEREAKKAGRDAELLPQWRPNQLRHSAATEAAAKFGLEAAQVLLGHANMQVTEIYAERDFQKAAAIAAQIG